MKDFPVSDPQAADIELNATDFFAEVIRTLSGELETTVGLEEAEGYINVVGRCLGDQIAEAYVREMGQLPGDIEGIAAILIDLKRRIGGNFALSSVEKDRMHFVNTRCPFGDRVKDRPSLCMMTTNVFGRIAAQANGYAHVEASETISQGSPCCRVTVSLDETSTDLGKGYEFYR